MATAACEAAAKDCCANCGISFEELGMKLKRCGKCKIAKYCTRKCQVEDWPRHREECGKEPTLLRTKTAFDVAPWSSKIRTVFEDHLCGVSLRESESPEKGRYVVAKRPFAPGDIVFAGEAFAVECMGHSLTGCCTHCTVYAPEKMVIDCCPKCGYQCCSPECRKESQKTHMLSCNARDRLQKTTFAFDGDWELFDLIYERHSRRYTSSAIGFEHLLRENANPSNGYSTADGECIRLLASILANWKGKTLDDVTGIRYKTRFADILELSTDETDLKPALWANIVAKMKAVLPAMQLIIPDITCEQLASLLLIIKKNAFPVFDYFAVRQTGVGIFPALAFINHSCRPNCIAVERIGSSLVVRAVRPIKMGEEVCISYIDTHLPRETRQLQLWDGFRFHCKCERCLQEKKGFDPLTVGMCPSCHTQVPAPFKLSSLEDGKDPGDYLPRAVSCPKCKKELETVGYQRMLHGMCATANHVAQSGNFAGVFPLLKEVEFILSAKGVPPKQRKLQLLLHPHHSIRFTFDLMVLHAQRFMAGSIPTTVMLLTKLAAYLRLLNALSVHSPSEIDRLGMVNVGASQILEELALHGIDSPTAAEDFAALHIEVSDDSSPRVVPVPPSSSSTDTSLSFGHAYGVSVWLDSSRRQPLQGIVKTLCAAIKRLANVEKRLLTVCFGKPKPGTEGRLKIPNELKRKMRQKGWKQ